MTSLISEPVSPVDATARQRTLSLATIVSEQEQITFLPRTVRAAGQRCRYNMFVPRYWTSRRKWPAILFLHGEGEGGDQHDAEPQDGVLRLLALLGPDFPCVLVCPQCPPDRGWLDPDTQKLALAALGDAMDEANGDAERVYLTGFSMGGDAVWELARRYPNRWAAIVPVGAGPIAASTTVDPDPYGRVACRLRDMPAWIFHGACDRQVPVAEPRQVVAAMYSLRSDVRFTEYASLGHDVAENAYAEPDLLKWLLSHKLPHRGNYGRSSRSRRY